MGVEASTVLMIPKLVHVNDHAFLADDTLIGSYELGGGWLRVERVKVGKRAFVGNSGMLAPGRKVPKESLVAVLSAAPRRGSAEPGTVLDRQPPGPAAPGRQRRGRQPHLRPAAEPAAAARTRRGCAGSCRWCSPAPCTPESASRSSPSSTPSASGPSCCSAR